MSDDRLKRRRFLADALFAGSAVVGASLLSRWAVAGQPEEPKGSPTPSSSPMMRGEPEPPRVKGDVAPTCTPTPSQPPTGGKPMAPPR